MVHSYIIKRHTHLARDTVFWTHSMSMSYIHWSLHKHAAARVILIVENTLLEILFMAPISFSLRILDELTQEVFGPTLKFLATDCCTALLTDTGSQSQAVNGTVTGVMEIASFLKIFSALLDKVVLREELDKKVRVDDTDGENGNPSIWKTFVFGKYSCLFCMLTSLKPFVLWQC